MNETSSNKPCNAFDWLLLSNSFVLSLLVSSHLSFLFKYRTCQC
jgi:hypothetical protein